MVAACSLPVIAGDMKPINIMTATGAGCDSLGAVFITFNDTIASIEKQPSIEVHSISTNKTIEADWLAFPNNTDKTTATLIPANPKGGVAPIPLSKEASYYITIPKDIIAGKSGERNHPITIIVHGGERPNQ